MQTNTNLLNPLFKLSNEAKAQAFDALVSIASGNTDTNLNPDSSAHLAVEFIVSGFEANIDSLVDSRAREMYLSRVRSEAGKKGAKKATQAKKSATTSTPKKRTSENKSSASEICVHKKNSTTHKVVSRSSSFASASALPAVTKSYSGTNKESIYQDLFNFFEENVPNLKHSPSRPRLTKKMLQNLDSVLEQFSPDEIKELFLLANSNKFLSGHGANHWVANFTWLLDPDHLVNVKSGFYTCNESSQPSTATKKNNFNNFPARDLDYGSLELQLLRK